MNNNPYMRNYISSFNQQNISEQIDYQINQLQQMKEQMKNNQQPAINQTFQLAPSNNHTMKYANTIDDVVKENVYLDTPFFSKDMSVLWIKNTKGDIKTYELTEIVPKDEKDMQIETLQARIKELERNVINEPSYEYADESVENEKPSSIQEIRRNKKK